MKVSPVTVQMAGELDTLTAASVNSVDVCTPHTEVSAHHTQRCLHTTHIGVCTRTQKCLHTTHRGVCTPHTEVSAHHTRVVCTPHTEVSAHHTLTCLHSTHRGVSTPHT